MTNRIHRYFQAVLTLALTFVIGFYVIPWLRLHPDDIHNYVKTLPILQQRLFAPFSCLFLVFLFFKLFSPRLIHLKHFIFRPPVWSACLLGIIFLGCYDLIEELGPDGYEGSQLVWLVYIPLSFIFWGILWHSGDSIVQPKSQNDSKSTLVKSIEQTDLEDIEHWLNTNDDSNYDLLGNRQVASRLAGLLVDNNQSIGIVGPFGSGKSTIVQWMEDELKSDSNKIIISPHSCWGFKDSTSSMYEMLDEAIKKIELVIDTFQIRSLPESYRKTFASTGNWGKAFSNLFLGKLDLSDQLNKL